MTTEITGKKRRNDQQLYSQGHMLQSPLAPRYTPQFDLISNILHDGIETRPSSLKNTTISMLPSTMPLGQPKSWNPCDSIRISTIFWTPMALSWWCLVLYRLPDTGYMIWVICGAGKTNCFGFSILLTGVWLNHVAYSSYFSLQVTQKV